MRRFPLAWREVPGRGFVQNALPEGVALATDGIAWGAELERRGSLAAIEQLVLRPFTTDDDGVAWGQCEIRFRGGRKLIVLSLGAKGASSGARNTAYAAFLRGLHARLGEGDRARIVFRDGAASASFWATALLAPFGIVIAALFLVKPLGWAPEFAVMAVLPLVAGFLALLLHFARPSRWHYRPDALPARALAPQGTDKNPSA